jgi:cyclohexanone monooxygenase
LSEQGSRLSAAKLPEIPGIGEFRGAAYHTARWPHDGVDFTGLRVGLIGTGSSAVQSIPVIAEHAAELTVSLATRAG